LNDKLAAILMYFSKSILILQMKNEAIIHKVLGKQRHWWEVLQRYFLLHFSSSTS